MKYLTFIAFILTITFFSCSTSSNRLIEQDKKYIKSEVKDYLKKSIENPRSYKAVDWEIIPKFYEATEEPDKYIVRHEYKAKDGIGTERNESHCFIFSKRENVLLKDASCIEYKEIYNKIVDDIKDAL